MLCPICHQHHSTLLHQFNGDDDAPLLQKLQEEVPSWIPTQGACTRCVDQAQLEVWSAHDALTYHAGNYDALIQSMDCPEMVEAKRRQHLSSHL